VWESLQPEAIAADPGSSLIGEARTLPPPEAALGPALVALGDLDRLRLGGEAPAFVIGESLGRGGMGEVHSAIDCALRREVAVKSLSRGASSASSQALLQEALFTGYLEHPNVVPVHRLGTDAAGRPAMVMKRIAGTSWLELIRDADHPGWASLSEDRLRAHLEILIQVCNAVHFAHSRGILHRDIKPANVMVGEYGEVYLVDWGLAIGLSELGSAQGGVVGTLAYMAPEMLEEACELSTQTDVYLLGATLHQVLTGKPRHQGSAHYNVMVQALRSPPIEYPPDVPAELAELANRATRREPSERYASALEFRQAVERFLEHRGSIELAKRAGERLNDLERAYDEPGDGSGRETAALFAACRFGFEQALDVWPENQQAREGLQRCLELTIERELAARNAGWVATLLPSLIEPRPDLEQQLAALQAEQAEEAAARERLEALEREHDLGVGGVGRALSTALLALLGYLGILGLAQSHGWGQDNLAYSTAFGFGLGLGGVMLVGLAVGWRWLATTVVNRKLIAMAWAGWLGGMLNVALCWVYQFPPVFMILYVGVIMVVVGMQVAAAFDRRLFGPMAFGVLALFSGVVDREIDPFIVHAVTGTVIFTWIGWMWFRDPPRA
jgi:serine/threonine-protein kinase